MLTIFILIEIKKCSNVENSFYILQNKIKISEEKFNQIEVQRSIHNVFYFLFYHLLNKI